jgi:hypothetical protein
MLSVINMHIIILSVTYQILIMFSIINLIFITLSVVNMIVNILSVIYLIEQHALKNANNCLNTNIYSYFETWRGGQSSNIYLNAVHFFQHQC